MGKARLADEVEAGMALVTQERDETIDLLQQAVEQNRDMKLKTRETKQKFSDDRDAIFKAQESNQAAMKSLLFTIENLIAQQGANYVPGGHGAELRQDLIKIRDMMRHLMPPR